MRILGCILGTDSIRIACSEATRNCAVSGLVDHSVTHPATRRRAGGLASVE